MSSTDPFYQEIIDNAKQKANSLGNILLSKREVTWMNVLQVEADQTNLIAEAVANGAKAIIITPVNDNIGTALDNAKAAGIKIILVDTKISCTYDAYIGTDNEAAGRKAAEKLAATGFTGTVSILASLAGIGSTSARIAGFQAKIAADYSSITCYSPTYYGESSAAAAISSGGAIFATNDGATYAAGDANTGGTKTIIGFDLSAGIQGLLDLGQITAVLIQKPDLMGSKAMEAAWKLCNGDSFPTDTDTGITVYP
jgi:ribose transport system substrate-binding protein